MPYRTKTSILSREETRHRHFTVCLRENAARPRGELGFDVPDWKVYFRVEAVYKFDGETGENAGENERKGG